MTANFRNRFVRYHFEIHAAESYYSVDSYAAVVVDTSVVVAAAVAGS